MASEQQPLLECQEGLATGHQEANEMLAKRGFAALTSLKSPSPLTLSEHRTLWLLPRRPVITFTSSGV